MAKYTKSIARTVMETADIHKVYFKDVPEGIITPSLYVPSPSVTGSQSALSSYYELVTYHLKIFDKSRLEAWNRAQVVTRYILSHSGRLPIYNADGSESGEIIKIQNPYAEVIDDGVAQVTVQFKTYRLTVEERGSKAGAVIWDIKEKK